MVHRSLPGGIDAIGSAKARFFHPSANIWEKWPQDDKYCLMGVLITGEGQKVINRKIQNCYIVYIPEIDDSSEFYIVKKNFQVISPAQPFPGETHCIDNQQC